MNIKRFIIIVIASLAPVFGAYAAEQLTSPFPPAMKNLTPIDDGTAAKIQGGVDLLLDGLAKARPEQVKPYRDMLCNEARTQQGVTPAFQAAFAKALAASVPKVYAETQNVQFKLNLAIIVGKVAENTGSSALEPAIRVVLQEKQSPVFVTWGLHGMRYIMPEIHKAGNAKDYIALVVETANAAPSGPNFDEAYEALRPSDLDGKLYKAFPQLADALLSLIESRVKQYQTGCPEDPYLEIKPLNNLGAQAAWAAMTTEQHQRWMQVALVLLAQGGVRSEEYKGTTNRVQIVNVINNICKTCVVISALQKNDKNWANLSQIADKASRRTSMSVVPDSFDINKEITEIAPAILKIPEFKSLVIPEPPDPIK